MENTASMYLAQVINNTAFPSFAGLSGVAFFAALIPALLSMVFVVGSIVFVFFLLWGGASWITAGSDKVAMENARNRITQALVGLIILFASLSILNFAECFFGIGLRDIAIGPFNIYFLSSTFCP